jgi:hypothetical protein
MMSGEREIQDSKFKIQERPGKSSTRQREQSIQNSEFRGERHVNAKIKRLDQATREREEFLKELAEVRAQGA